MREGRPVRGGAAQTRELLRRNEAISAELERRGVRQEDPQLQRALQGRGQAMPDAGPQDGTVVKGRAMPDARSIFGKPTESDSGGATWRFGRGDSQLDVFYSKDRNTFYVNAGDAEHGPYASVADAADALLEVGQEAADKARPAIERDALRDGLTASKKVAGEGGIRSVGVSRVKGSTKSDSLYFDVNVELDPKLGKQLYDQGVQDRRDTGSWSWEIDDDAGVIESARISVRVSDHADVSAFSKSSAAIQDFVTPTRRGDWLQSADRVMQDIEDRLGAPLPRLKIQKPAITDGPLEAVASRLAAVRSKQQPSQPAANVNSQSSAAPRGQAMPDVTITPDEARRQGLVGPVYHGSPDFKGRKFDPKYRARSSGLSRGGFSFTEDVASADSYAGAGVDSAQAAVDAANDVMRDLGARMEAGLKLREFADISELPEFNVRYADDMDELASYFNDLSKRIPKDLGARLRDAAKAINEPANPVVVEAYLRNPKEMMIDGKRLLVAENPDDIFVSAARPPQQ
jgi:hypothetical protein